MSNLRRYEAAIANCSKRWLSERWRKDEQCECLRDRFWDAKGHGLVGTDWASAITFVGVMTVYLATMMPGSAFVDTGEFQTVTYVLGVAHPTGYPFYTMFGKLFGTLIPIGSWAYRMNLLSALSASGAAAILVVFARRLGVTSAIAIAAGLSFAFALNTWRAGGRLGRTGPGD